MLNLFFFIVFALLLSEARAQDCASGSFYEDIQGTSKFTVATGTWYLNTGTPNTCSGQVDKYDVSYYSFTGESHSVYVALWKPISTGSTTYEMIDSSVQELTTSSKKRRKRSNTVGHVDFAHSNLYVEKGSVVGVFFSSNKNSLPIIGTKNNLDHKICIQSQSSLTDTVLNCSLAVPTDKLIHAMATIKDNVECKGSIPNINDGTSSLMNGDISYGARAQYTCDTGYVITSGDEYLVCNENGQWAGTPPTCTITCPSITSISNGSVSGSSSTFIYQSTLSFTCDTGYELEGVSSIICQSSGQWSNSIPVCTIVNCSNPGTPENGKITSVDATFTYQSVIIYECNNGFEIHGVSSIVCTSSGDWNNSLPICTAAITSTTSVDKTSMSILSSMDTNSIITSAIVTSTTTTTTSVTSPTITITFGTSSIPSQILAGTSLNSDSSSIVETDTTTTGTTTHSTTTSKITTSTTTTTITSTKNSVIASDSTQYITQLTATLYSSSIADSSLSITTAIPTSSTNQININPTSSTLVGGSNPSSLTTSNMADNSLLIESTTGTPSQSPQRESSVASNNSPLGAVVGVMAVLLVALATVIVVIFLVLLIKRKRKGKVNINADNDIQKRGFDNCVYDHQDVIGINTTGSSPNISNPLYEDLPEHDDTAMSHQQKRVPQQQEQQTMAYETIDQYQRSSSHSSSSLLPSRSIREYFELENTIPPDVSPHFQEEPIYWQPETSKRKIYEQLTLKRYREIPPNKIVITDQLGSGQFGTAEKGLWYSNQEPVVVAVKTLKGIASEEEELKFLQEAAINGQFHHPNVVELYGVVTAGQPIMIILEYVPNGDLKAFLVNKQPQPGDMDSNKEQLIQLLINFSKQIASGMVYLSGKRFIHRDLAARNILVADNNICKIADFGMSRDLQDEAYYRSNSKRIPVKWTAPEAIHYRKYSTESDVWSFGALLYEVWSVGYKPFQLYTNQEYIDLIDSGFRISAPLGCPKFIYNLMIMCWNPIVSERPTFEYLQAELLKTSTIFEEAASLKASLGSSIDNDRSIYPELQYKYKSVD